MGFLTRMSHSLFALLLCMAAGAVAGVYAPAVGDVAYVAAQVYLSIVSMAAIPLLVVATFFGLRQTMGLPFPARRIAMIAGLALLLVAGCAATGLALGWMNAPGAHLDAESREHLGELVQRAGDGGDIEMRLYDSGTQATPVERPRATFLPDNFFRVLVEGRSLGILSCALLFGLAFAALARSQHNALNHMFEGIYRTLELIIARANILLPVVAFGMSAHVLSQTDAITIRAMSGFLLHFVVLVALLGTAAIAVIHRRGNQPLAEVLQHLKAPMLVSLVSSSTTASIPHTIEAMSARLGFSRGIVELVVPTASVFLRAGSALYYVLLALFVANLYDRTLSAADIGMIGTGATIAAFASAGNSSLTNVGYAGIVLSLLQLPIEAALALFLAIDLICEGPRNLLTLLCSCALIAIVSAGLPSERMAAPATDVAPVQPLRFVLTRGNVALLAGCSVLASLLILLMGIAVGARQAVQPSAAYATSAAANPGISR
ncbi:dicarboxylate/amino acid:cation symporter [Variovorax sp. E3]|uniref:dicarboxylate/amino acid:cation symporter n=1 Tax=Variovorax sp. E3 TaxID=1914993 RepID=UPI0018DD5CAC|nr:cation:dicarboxylase symporter family transporter [Variovorax sp. E3]